MISFFIAGIPRAQGSKRHVGGGRMIEASKYLPEWRRTVSHASTGEWGGRELLNAPTGLEMSFILPRPKAWGKNRNDPMTQRPDLDKLIRAVMDGITGTIITDDSQATHITATKRRAAHDEQPGVHVTITPIEQEKP